MRRTTQGSQERPCRLPGQGDTVSEQQRSMFNEALLVVLAWFLLQREGLASHWG